jgi:hypothetical protein
MAENRVVLEFKPHDGPRRRVTFEPDRDVDDWEYEYWRVDEVYETDEGVWRERGREHVTEPDVTVETEDTLEAADA